MAAAEHYQTRSLSDSVHQSSYHHYRHAPTDEVAMADQPAGHGSRVQPHLQQVRCGSVCSTDQQEDQRPPDEHEQSSDKLQA